MCLAYVYMVDFVWLKACSSECDASEGCYGPLSSDCVKCRHLQLSVSRWVLSHHLICSSDTTSFTVDLSFIHSRPVTFSLTARITLPTVDRRWNLVPLLCYGTHSSLAASCNVLCKSTANTITRVVKGEDSKCFNSSDLDSLHNTLLLCSSFCDILIRS